MARKNSLKSIIKLLDGTGSAFTLVGWKLVIYIAIPDVKNLRSLWRECGKVIDEDLGEADFDKIKLVRELIINSY